MSPIDGREVVESPEELEQISVCPRERCSIDHTTAVPSEQAGIFTEKSNREGKETELGAVDGSRIENELATSLVGTTGPTDVTSDTIHIPSQFLDCHEGVIDLGFVFNPQLDESPVECCLLLTFGTHVWSARKNGDIGFENIGFENTGICRAGKGGGIQEV